MNSKKGILYGVSVGPGDPELLTLKGVKVIESCPVIAAPETNGKNTLALDIARGAVNLEGKKIIELPFLMTRDKKARDENHGMLAEKLKAELLEGNDIALLNLGDVSIYSTFSYMMEIIQAQGFEVIMIPGVPSFCAVAATLGISLTTMDSPLHILPASSGSNMDSLKLEGTKVLMKTGKSMPEVRREIIESGLSDVTKMVQNCGLPNQIICHKIHEARDEISYFTTIVVKG